MIKEAIILAGGLGTRLRTVVADRPKCMAPINNRPFLHYLITYLKESGIQRFIFSVGYMHEVIEEYLSQQHASLRYELSIESEPLGTGGAIKLACEKAGEANVVACNGDTLFKVDLSELSNFHYSKKGDCSLCLKPMHDFDRYGVVELNSDGSVGSFNEKRFYKSGLINGGVYALNIDRFKQQHVPKKFSFEKDYLEKNAVSLPGKNAKIFGLIQDQYFIDIGIPEDYETAGRELQ